MKIPSDPGRIRTPNPQSRNLVFYPVELRGQKYKYEKLNFHRSETPVPSKVFIQ